MKNIALITIFALLATGSDAQIITTIAGNGVAGYTGNGGSATDAQIRTLGDVTVDGSGNVYFTQESDHVVRKVDGLSGMITTVAGNGIQGFSGDGGPATSASLTFSGSRSGVAADASGNLYISDFTNNRIRKVDRITGLISTIAIVGSPGDLVLDGTGNLYVASYFLIRRVQIATGITTTIAGIGPGFSGDGGLATAAQLSSETRIAIGSNKIYIADVGNFRVRAVDLTSGIITTVAGGGSSYLDGVPATTNFIWPRGVSVDGNGDLYISSGKIWKVVSSTGIMSTAINGPGFSGDYGPAALAQVSESWGLAFGNNGNMYIADTYNNRVRKVWSCMSNLNAPSTARKCQNAAATPFTATVTGTGSYSFQWYSNTSPTQTGATLIPGATGASYVPPTSALGYAFYYARITGACGTLATPFYWLLTEPQMAIVNQPSTGAQTGCPGEIFPQITVAASGTNLAYQWYYNTVNNNTSGTFLGGLIGPAFTPASHVAGTKYYYAKITGCTTLTSSTSGPITSYAYTTITTQPDGSNSYSPCQYQQGPTFSVVAAGSNLNYQWYQSTTGFNSWGTPIPGANASSYVTNTSTVGTLWYYVIVSGSCGTVTSNISGGVDVRPALIITSQPGSSSQLLCQNAAPVPLAVAASGSGLTYQWWSSPNPSGTMANTIPGATQPSYTPSTATPGTTYYLVRISGTCGPVLSAVSGAIIVNAPTVITGQPNTASQSVCQGLPLISLAAQGTGAGLSYQWFSNVASSNTGGTAIAGATGATYTPPSNTPGTKYYYVVITGSCGTLASAVSGAIIVNASTGILSHPSTTAQAVCQGSTVNQLTVTATGSGMLIYQWYSSTTSSTSGGTSINGATASSYTPPTTLPGTKYYYVQVTGNCGTMTSNASGQVTINSIPTATISGIPSFCSGTATTLTSSPGTSYVWSTGATTQSIAVSTAGNYAVTVIGSGGCAKTSPIISISELPATGSITHLSNICDGPVYLTAGSGSGFLWGHDYSQSQSVWVYNEGTYSVSYHNVPGCFVTATVTLGGDCTPGGGTQARKAVAETPESNDGADQNFKLGIYPNPAQDQLLIVLTVKATQDSPVLIYDVLGRLSKSAIIERGSKSKTINISDLQTGIYVVDIMDNKRARQRKLIVQRD